MDTFVIFAFVLLCVQVAFRQAYKDQQLDSVSKLLFLELIELRSSQWVANEAQANYYRQKLNQIDPALLQSAFPTKANSDKAFVQRSISLNVNAMEFNPSKTVAPRVQDEHSAIVICGDDVIVLTGHNKDLIESSKVLLEDNLNNQNHIKSRPVGVIRTPLMPGSNTGQTSPTKFMCQERRDRFSKTAAEKLEVHNPVDKKPAIRYDRDTLVKLSADVCFTPINWDKIIEELPMVKKGFFETLAPRKNEVKSVNGFRVDGLDKYYNINNNKYQDLGAKPKKNFLEVLRPDAPPRVWCDNQGEWVEAAVDNHQR